MANLDPRSWETYFQNPTIALKPRKLLNPGDSVFTIGSCFALEVRRALSLAGVKTYPDYWGVPYEKTSEIFDNMPAREMPAHYDTFAMLQEFEDALGQWTDRNAGFWEVKNAQANSMLGSESVFQDPYRKLTYATTREGLSNLSTRITAAVREGLAASQLIVITLGLTEVWQHNLTGKYLCRPPNSGFGGGKNLATFRLSTFLENYQNLKSTLDLIFNHYPEKRVIVSVSPVRLQNTHSAVDVGTANLESKSILRAVAGQICREYSDRVMYFPSYEFAMLGTGAMTATGEVFESDGRHVQRGFVDHVIKAFMASFT